ncbi:MAG: diguanylate cyclase [Gammaproteobacteria bacterium]|nr:diguanylate cyclase [Gammaproteobacteria bacterium]
MPNRNKKIFLLLSLLILFSDVMFVVINHYASERSLHESLEKQSQTIQNSFSLTMSLVYENMLQLASFVGNDRKVQQLFLKGKKAVEAEGGGVGGKDSATVREQLYEQVSPGWNLLMEQFDIRQLHFHLGPGSLSFLRVHRPDKFGDRMDDIRHIIVDTYDEMASNTGFETGRVYSGLRGTVPIIAHDAEVGREVIVGVLEVGTSFKTVLKKLKSKSQVESLVLLNEEHVKSTMWPQFINSKLRRLSPDAPCYIEAASSPISINIVRNCSAFSGSQDGLSTFRTWFNGRDYAITRIPLYDYRAMKRSAGHNGSVGAVMVLTDISSEVELHEQQFRLNLIIAVFGFIIIETLLFISLRLAANKLQTIIDKQIAEIVQLKNYFEERSQRDGLTSLYNHRAFIERLDEEMHRTKRLHSPFSLIMLDLDHFKRLNDTYGHGAGDEVLVATANCIGDMARKSDIVGRYGGEEFCLALPDTDLESAQELAERLLEMIRTNLVHTSRGEVLSITASIGISQWDEESAISGFIYAADQAMYLAKEQGRDRVVVAS